MIEKVAPDACDTCGQHQIMHGIGTAGECCGCHVKGGNPPAEWHVVCMETYHNINQTSDRSAE